VSERLAVEIAIETATETAIEIKRPGRTREQNAEARRTA
jgi:hypothetical protein